MKSTRLLLISFIVFGLFSVVSAQDEPAPDDNTDNPVIIIPSMEEPAPAAVNPSGDVIIIEPMETGTRTERPGAFLSWPLPAQYGPSKISRLPNSAWTHNFLGITACPPYPALLDPGSWNGKTQSVSYRDHILPNSSPARATWNNNDGRIACYLDYDSGVPFGHDGTDITAPNGTAIYAAAAGTVVSAYQTSVGGKVIIRHPNVNGKGKDWYTIYLHLTNWNVSNNQVVSSGQQIGTVGQGHLHFEVGVAATGSANKRNPWGVDAAPWDDCMWLDGNLCQSVTTPVETNVVQNNLFDNQNFWTHGGDSELLIQNGLAKFLRPRTDIGWATMGQYVDYDTVPNGVYQLALGIANQANYDKTVKIHIRSSLGWQDALTCTFNVPANAPMERYVLRGKVPNAAWPGIQVVFGQETVDSGTGYTLFDNVNFRYRPDYESVGLECLGPDINLVRNPDLSNGIRPWTAAGDATIGLPDQILHLLRLKDEIGWATVYNHIVYAGMPNHVYEVKVDLGNNADYPKTVRVNLRNSEGWPDALVCEFVVPAHAGLETYMVQGRIPDYKWPEMRFSVGQVTVDPAGGKSLLIDNASVMYRPDLTVTGTNCIGPAGEVTTDPTPQTELTLVSPVGIVEVANPIYVWTPKAGASSYDLRVDMGSTVLFQTTVSASQYCNTQTCAVDVTDIPNVGGWLTTGSYEAYLRATGEADWVGPSRFTVQAVQPDIVTILAPLNQELTHPTLQWTMYGNATFASWFRLYLAPSNNLGMAAIDTWVARDAVCTSDGESQETCFLPLSVELMPAESYALYIQSWGPGGFSTGGLGGWAGPMTFYVGGDVPTAPENVSAVVDGTSLVITWSDQDVAQWYQVYAGGSGTLFYMNWSEKSTICNAGTCSLNVSLFNPPSGNFDVWIRSWGNNAFSIGGTDGWTGPVTFTIN